jgi:hypothetical protein
MTTLTLILAMLATGAVAIVMALGFFAGGSRERREALVADLARVREPEREAA